MDTNEPGQASPLASCLFVLNSWPRFRGRKHVRARPESGEWLWTAIRKLADVIGRKIFILRSRDVQNGRGHRLVLVFRPILGDAAADREDAARFLRVGS